MLVSVTFSAFSISKDSGLLVMKESIHPVSHTDYQS